QRVETARDADAEGHAAPGGEGPLEGLHLRPVREGPGVDQLADVGEHLRFEPRVGEAQVEERNAGDCTEISRHGPDGIAGPVAFLRCVRLVYTFPGPTSRGLPRRGRGRSDAGCRPGPWRARSRRSSA